MKKTIAILLCILTVALTLSFGAPASADDITVKLNSETLSFDENPVIANGRVLVPFRAIFEALGCVVSWESQSQTVIATTSSSNTIELTIGKNEMKKNDNEAVILDSAPIIQAGRTMVPVRAISEALGANVDWEEESKTVTITTEDTVKVSYKDDDYSPEDWASVATEFSEGDTIEKSGTYEISGKLETEITVNVDKEIDKGTVYLVINNADISVENSAAINIVNAKKAVIVLPDETENTITQIVGEEADTGAIPSAAIFSDCDLTITGNGKLSVTTHYNDGITSKDKLKITGGELDISAAADGIVGKDVLGILACSLNVTSGKDGLRATNEEEGNIIISDGTFDITAENDAIQAEGTLKIDGGSFLIKSGGGYNGVISSGNAFGNGQGFNRPNRDMNNAENMTRPNARPLQNDAEPSLDIQANTAPIKETVIQQDAQLQKEQDSTLDYSATGTEESKKGLKAAKAIIINGGAFNLSTYEDAVHSNGNITVNSGNLNINAGDDGFHADSSLTVNGGTIIIENCYEGLEAVYLTVNDGDITLNAKDDGYNSAERSGSIVINGGKTTIYSQSDGIDSNGTITINDGDIYIDGPTTGGGEGALDYDVSMSITGGNIICTATNVIVEMGNSSQAVSNQQNSLIMYYTESCVADSSASLKDSDGNTIISFTPKKSYSNLLISSPEIQLGESYTLCADGEDLVSFTAVDNRTYLNPDGITQKQQGNSMGGMNKGNRPFKVQ